MLKEAMADTMRRWISPTGLVLPGKSQDVLHFEPDTPPPDNGIPVSEADPDFEAAFIMSNGAPIIGTPHGSANNGPSPTSPIGLIPGTRGAIRLRAQNPSKPFLSDF